MHRQFLKARFERIHSLSSWNCSVHFKVRWGWWHMEILMKMIISSSWCWNWEQRVCSSSIYYFICCYKLLPVVFTKRKPHSRTTCRDRWHLGHRCWGQHASAVGAEWDTFVHHLSLAQLLGNDGSSSLIGYHLLVLGKNHKCRNGHESTGRSLFLKESWA